MKKRNTLSTRMDTLALSATEDVLAGNGRKQNSITACVIPPSPSCAKTVCGCGAFAGSIRRNNNRVRVTNMLEGRVLDGAKNIWNAGIGIGFMLAYIASYTSSTLPKS